MNALIRQPLPSIKGARGVTLVELMIATVVLSTAVIGLIGAFMGIQKSMQISNNKTLAANLGQEQMQILTQLNYYQALVTPSPSFYTVGAVTIPYDTTYFPLQTIVEGHVTYTWLTNVQVAEENNGSIIVLPPATPDTGMKLITITVVWSENGIPRMYAINSVLSNPNTVMSNSFFTGKVTDATTGLPISGAVVDIAENMGWRDTTNASGVYTINVNIGSYEMVASAAGYFPQYLLISIGQNVSATQNFSLQAMSSGTVTGTAWVSNNLVISQVVQDTFTLCQDGLGALSMQNVEYVEIFNPTPLAVNLQGTPGSSWFTPGKNPSLWLMMESGGGLVSDYAGEYNTTSANYSLDLTYVNSTVNSNTYFLYANTPRFVLNGIWVTADAYYTPGTGMAWGGAGPPVPPDIPHFLSAIPSHAGFAGLVNYTPATGSWSPVDEVRWLSATSGSGGPPNVLGNVVIVSTAMIPNGATASLGSPAGNQIVRISSPAASASGMVSFGHAYNSQNNQLDYEYPSQGLSGITYMPHNVFSGAFAVVSGQPAVGAVVTGNDPLSTSATAYLVGSPPVANFILPSVSTTSNAFPWTVVITSGNYTLSNTSVYIPAAGANYNFPSSTTILNLSATTGFIAGTVTDIFGNPISGPAITVNAGAGHATASTSDGRYLVATATGSVDVVSNPSNANSSYVSISSLAVTVQLGQIHDNVNFVLSQGGQITGFVTRDGVNALPGVTITATDSNGIAQDSEVSNTSGRFTTISMATGSYTLTPELDSLEVSVPVSESAIVGSGQVVFSTTFTVSGAEGTISGSVTKGGAPITTGVLIVVTTSTLAGVPPAPPTISSSTLAASSIYMASSLESGTYSVGVRQSTSPTYNAYGYYTTLNSAGTVTFNTIKLSGISVVAGSSVTGQNFAW